MDKRSELIDMMGVLKLAGVRANFDDVLARARRCRHGIEQALGELLKVEIAEKQAHSIRYQMGAAKLPLAKELADFVFDDTPVNEPVVRDLATGAFLVQQRNVVLIGGRRCSTGSPITARLSRLATTAGVSNPSPIPCGGQYCMPIRGQCSAPIDIGVELKAAISQSVIPL